MESFELILILVGMVLVSAVFSQLLTRLSLPLVQIALGIVVTFIVGEPLQITIDPELFLVLFIAPLLFDESRSVSKHALAKNLPSILSLAIGLVLVSMLVVGFTLNWLVPSIPLAVAFALGAALGPTDAVAVSALSESVRLNKRQEALLSGEALINDASGVVSFQFAVAAAVTGAFSFIDAGETFLFVFMGGLLLGAVLGVVALVMLRAVSNLGLESFVFPVAFELFVPFIVYLIAELIGVSGILAVVAAGLLMTLVPKAATATSARVLIVSGSVWEVLTFLLNGVVFVLLGMQLPQAMLPSWEESVHPFELLGLVLLISLVCIGIRFIWLLIMEMRSKPDDAADDRRRGFSLSAAKDALVTTLAGPKGAVTLSIAFTLPYAVASGNAFPFRSGLIFIASGVIVCTLLLANFMVPILSPLPEDDRGEKLLKKARLEMYRRTLASLRDKKGTEPDWLLAAVCSGFERQITALESGTYPNTWRALRERLVRTRRMRAAREDELLEADEEINVGNQDFSTVEERDSMQEQVRELQAEALRLELGHIEDMRREGLISKPQAHELRESVYLLQMSLSESAR